MSRQARVRWSLPIAAATRTRLRRDLKLSNAPASLDRLLAPPGPCPPVLMVCILLCLLYGVELVDTEWSTRACVGCLLTRVWLIVNLIKSSCKKPAVTQGWKQKILAPPSAPQSWLVMTWWSIYQPLSSSWLLKSQWAVLFEETCAHTLLLKMLKSCRSTVTQVQRWTVPAFQWENKLLRGWLKSPPVNHRPCWLPTSWLVTSNHIHAATDKNPKSYERDYYSHDMLTRPLLGYTGAEQLCVHVQTCKKSGQQHLKATKFWLSSATAQIHLMLSTQKEDKGAHSWCWRQNCALFHLHVNKSAWKSSPWKSPFKSSTVRDLTCCVHVVE